MYATQKQLLDSFVRVRAFLDEHPVTGPLNYTLAREMLDDALRLARECAGTQGSATVLSRAALRRQEQLIGRVKDEQMRPIVTIARAQIAPGSDVGLPAAFRMPTSKLPPQRMLVVCDGMIETARSFEGVLVSNGMPPDFLARFARARDEIARAMRDRATQTNARVGARKGLQVELRRGRLAVDRLDAVVRASFRGDEAVLEAWRVVKRVHRLTGGAATPAQRQGALDAAGEQKVNEGDRVVWRIAPRSGESEDRRTTEELHAA